MDLHDQSNKSAQNSSSVNILQHTNEPTRPSHFNTFNQTSTNSTNSGTGNTNNSNSQQNFSGPVPGHILPPPLPINPAQAPGPGRYYGAQLPFPPILSESKGSLHNSLGISNNGNTESANSSQMNMVQSSSNQASHPSPGSAPNTTASSNNNSNAAAQQYPPMNLSNAPSHASSVPNMSESNGKPINTLTSENSHLGETHAPVDSKKNSNSNVMLASSMLTSSPPMGGRPSSSFPFISSQKPSHMTGQDAQQMKNHQLLNHPSTIPVAMSHPSNVYGSHTQTQQPPQNLGQAQSITSPESPHRPNVQDALSYLDQVKLQFADQPAVYNRFLDIMKDFKAQTINTPGVIDRISTLFRGHSDLIQGFNTFLPPGYRIDCSLDPMDPNHIRVTTPMGIMTGDGSHLTNGSSSFHSQQWSNTMGNQGSRQLMTIGNAPGSPTRQNVSFSSGLNSKHYQINQDASLLSNYSNQAHMMPSEQDLSVQSRRGPVEFNHAITYVNKIKNRFSNEPETYKLFLEILQTYQREQRPIQDVYAQVTVIFKDAPDLLEDFKQFLPDEHGGSNGNLLSISKLPPVGTFAPPSSANNQPNASTPSSHHHQKRRRTTHIEDSSYAQNAAASSPAASTFWHQQQQLGIPQTAEYHIEPSLVPSDIVTIEDQLEKKGVTDEELKFFEKVRKYTGSKQTYNEFLKILNLFSQNILEKEVLLECMHHFIGNNKELMDWFKNFIQWDEDVEKDDNTSISNAPIIPGPRIDLTQCEAYGPSYRLLPKSETQLACSGRDLMCWEVLNDEWVSHPTWASEDSGFVAHRKNQFEEALHKLEEERYEYDLHIETNLRVIQMLEPIAQRISTMTAEERSTFTLPPGLGTPNISTYQKVLKKVYDPERGQEIINLLHSSPAIAVPVVLRRLKKKDEEWRRAQREWNKVWRETESKNYLKSLDHQGITFKASDRKTISNKAFLNEIDILKRMEDQNPEPGAYQFKFQIQDFGVISDILNKIVPSYVEHVLNNGYQDRGKMTKFLQRFLSNFFGLVKQASASNETSEDVDMEDPEDSSENKEFSDRDAVMQAEKASEVWVKFDEKYKSTTLADQSISNLSTAQRQLYTLFGNTNVYCFFRLFYILYERLYNLKQVSQENAAELKEKRKVNPIAVELGLVKLPETNETNENTTDSDTKLYPQVLKCIDKLFRGDLDQAQFEDSVRALYSTKGYKIYTIDKMMSAIMKQVHNFISEPIFQDMFLYYEHDRARNRVSYPRDLMVYRIQVETLLGSEDPIYKIDWHSTENWIGIRLMVRDNMTLDHKSASSELRWAHYIESYVMSNPTEGITYSKVRTPFLRRNLLQNEDEVVEAAKSEILLNSFIRSSLRIKICINTYRRFYICDTEDRFARNGNLLVSNEKMKQAKARRRSRFEKWLDSKSTSLQKEEKATNDEETTEANATNDVSELKVEHEVVNDGNDDSMNVDTTTSHDEEVAAPKDETLASQGTGIDNTPLEDAKLVDEDGNNADDKVSMESNKSQDASLAAS